MKISKSGLKHCTIASLVNTANYYMSLDKPPSGFHIDLSKYRVDFCEDEPWCCKIIIIRKEDSKITDSLNLSEFYKCFRNMPNYPDVLTVTLSQILKRNEK